MKSYSASMFVSLLTSDQQQTNILDDLSQSSRDMNDLHYQDHATVTTAIPVAPMSDTDEHQMTPKVDTRETWSNNCDYLITTLGGLIGLGRFLSYLDQFHFHEADEKTTLFRLIVFVTYSCTRERLPVDDDDNNNETECDKIV